MALAEKQGFTNTIFFIYIILSMLDLTDTRLEKWPLMGSPAFVIGIIVIYILGTTSLGPRFMRNRPPFRLRTIINCYNLLQIVWNSYVAYYVSYIIVFYSK